MGTSKIIWVFITKCGVEVLSAFNIFLRTLAWLSFPSTRQGSKFQYITQIPGLSLLQTLGSWGRRKSRRAKAKKVGSRFSFTPELAFPFVSTNRRKLGTGSRLLRKQHRNVKYLSSPALNLIPGESGSRLSLGD